MSLLGWWPLITNLSDYSGHGNHLTNTNSTAAVYNANGLLGGCYQNTSNQAGSMVTSKTINPGSTQSMFCWYNMTDVYSDASLNAICGQHRYAANKGMGITIKYVSSTTGYLSVNTGNGTSRTYNTYYGSTLLTAGEWYHLGYTYDGTTIRLYVNGELDGTFSYPNQVSPEDYFGVFLWSFSGTSGNSGYGNYIGKGRINDVRLYNHTLSLKEIKELAKARVLQYSFDSPMLKPINKYSGIQHNVSSMTATYQNSDTFAEYGINKTLKLTSNGSTAQKYAYSYLINPTGILTAGKTYMFSCYAYNTSTTADIRVHGEGGVSFSAASSGASGAIVSTLKNKVVKIWGYFTAVADGSNKIMFYPAPGTTGFSDGYQEFGGIQIYESDGTLLDYIDENIKTNIVRDNSGNGYDGTINNIIISSDTAVGTRSIYLDNTQYITVSNLDFTGLSTVSVSFWYKNVSWGSSGWVAVGGQSTSYYFMASEHNGNFYNQNAGTRPVKYYCDGVEVLAPINDNNWHLYCVTGLDLSTWTAMVINGYYSTWNTTCYYGDFSIYNRILSADDILSLYRTKTQIDKNGSVHTASLVEGENVGFSKSGVAKASAFCESSLINGLNPYDNNIYIEPDGSAWIRVVHHNAPASYLFSSSNTFTTGTYTDVNRWFCCHKIKNIPNTSNKYEFMVKQQLTTGGTVYKYRWYQNVEPMTATFDQTVAANVTYNTTAGYSSTSFGGLYKSSSNCYLNGNNATNGNWWGATGCWTQFSGGIPGWNSQAITTGYYDLYYRVDELSKDLQSAAISKTGIGANIFYEK